MQVTVNVPDDLNIEATLRGLTVETFVEEVLAQHASEHRLAERRHQIEHAADSIRELRKGTFLGGLKIRELIDEGRKY